MQTEMFIEQEDYSNEKVLLGLSGGINSAALACWLAQWDEHLKPKELHLFYVHFEEHSPDTWKFVQSMIKFCKANFKCVKVKIIKKSVLKFFESQNMIPHPQVAPCTRILKMLPASEYMFQNDIKIDMVGYVREEKRRIKNMANKGRGYIDNRSVVLEDVRKLFPISDKTNEWCFKIVKKSIGWYPKIYDFRFNNEGFISFLINNLHRVSSESQKIIKKKIGKRERVFPHNNCLPCKNMQEADYLYVEYFFKSFYTKSIKLSEKLNKHWGRTLKEKQPEDLSFSLFFGRTPEEVDYKQQTCGVCAFD